MQVGKPRYVFFSFPHIAINSKGELGALSRPGQDATSSACGAIIAALGQLKAEGLESNIVKPGGEPPACALLLHRSYRLALLYRAATAGSSSSLFSSFLFPQSTMPTTPSTPSSSSASPAAWSR